MQSLTYVKDRTYHGCINLAQITSVHLFRDLCLELQVAQHPLDPSPAHQTCLYPPCHLFCTATISIDHGTQVLEVLHLLHNLSLQSHLFIEIFSCFQIRNLRKKIVLEKLCPIKSLSW